MTANGEVLIDVYQKLANDRILFITDYITDDLASMIVATLLLKDQESSTEKITLFINSPGGSIRNIFMIYDVMSFLKSSVETICTGEVLNESFLLLIGGTKGMRMATQHASICVSQLINNWHTHTNMVDGKNLMQQMKNDNDRLLKILSKSTGKSIKQLKTDFDRPMYFNAGKAVKYGLIDKVIPNK